MTTLERSILIEATTQEIQTIALDANRLPEWYAGIQKAQPDETYPEVGGVVEAVYKAAGISFNIKMTTVELVWGDHQTLKMEGMITGTSRWVFTPEAEGTRVTATFDYEMPGGGLGKVFDKLLVERMNADNLDKSLKKLKTVAEGG